MAEGDEKKPKIAVNNQEVGSPAKAAWSKIGLATGTAMKMYKRQARKRVFVNRSLMLEKVKFYGFDMDYTLALYKSPEYETLGFVLLRDQLVEMGYPEEIKTFEYDPTFSIRGLWFDKLYGHLLKVDPFGNILICVHGFDFLVGRQIHQFYPNKFVNRDEKRFRIFNTLYELPIIYVLACLVNYFSNNPEYTQTKTGVKSGDVTMTYMSIYQDLMVAVDHVHAKKGPLKSETLKNLEKYVTKTNKLPMFLDRVRSNGAKVFLATNSDFVYTNGVMTYLFDYPSPSPDQPQRKWTSYFDYIVVDAKKPLFFGEGTVLRQVDTATGSFKLGTHTGPIKKGHVYSGGSVDVFSEMMGTYGKEVLYVGDHIFGDILKSKKVRGWRTFLIVPELAQELAVWTEKQNLFAELEQLDCQLGEIYKNLDSSCAKKPNIKNIQKAIADVSHEMDMSYGVLGSVFRSGSRQTFFAGQVMRYADLYAATILNLLNYPFSYVFRSPAMLMPHESTVNHDDSIPAQDFLLAPRTRSFNEPSSPNTPEGESMLVRQDSAWKRFVDTPRHSTHVHESEDEDEDEEGGEPAEMAVDEEDFE
ncbi:cytosolic purine 5'-nucleotidase-like [Liolophura sinensis]|uniref:cytosolic purine 5'-nucleotidase-like n=1 Tax=Liolophura sinensis TaxID=3198878 RepID=UPI003158FEFF